MYSSKQQMISFKIIVLLCFMICLVNLEKTSAMAGQEFLNNEQINNGNNFASSNRVFVEIDNAKEVSSLLQALAQNIEDARQGLFFKKRLIDLGLARGHSGRLAAKHMMGLASANWADGPGRKR